MNEATLTISEGIREISSILAEIEEIVIPEGVTCIGGLAFYSCSSLTGITIPNSVIEIGDSAFRNCSSLKEITIPDSVTSIGVFAFEGCLSLKSIYIDKEKDSLDLSYAWIPETTKIYWKGEWEKEVKE